jgi:hypothetical protein
MAAKICIISSGLGAAGCLYSGRRRANRLFCRQVLFSDTPASYHSRGSWPLADMRVDVHSITHGTGMKLPLNIRTSLSLARRALGGALVASELIQAFHRWMR